MKQSTKTEHPIHLCIGAPRCGTRWLFNNLREQTSVFTPCVKEVRYWFSQRNRVQVASAAFTARKRSKESHDANLQRDWLDKFEKIDPTALPSADVYKELMSISDRPSIDISPAYSFALPEIVSLIHESLPRSSKVIYFVRNPMERIESQMKLHWYLHGNFRGRASKDRHVEFLSDKLQLRRADYQATIDMWRENFGDRFRVLNYDDMRNDQMGFLRNVSEFLGIDLDFDIAKSTSNVVYGTNSFPRPKAGPFERKEIAKALAPIVTQFSESDVTETEKWMKQVHAATASNPKENVRIDDCSLKVQDLMRMTESLGDNCEYGFWQRHRGYEPSSLFRWAITEIDPLINFLENPLQEIFQESCITPYSRGMVLDTASGFKFHSKLLDQPSDDGLKLLEGSDWREIFDQEKAKIDYLSKKFLDQMKKNPAVYIIKRNGGLDIEAVKTVRDTLINYNPSHRLLWVECGDKCGDIQEIDENLLLSKIDRFANYTNADKYSESGWTRIMHQLAEREDISQLISNMAR